MSEPNPTADDRITIGREDALSKEVDDFLSRQRNLRGEGGIAGRPQEARWYLSNWFLFAVAGGIAAFLVWAVTEPYFDDRFYIQGAIEEVDLSTPMPSEFRFGFQQVTVSFEGQGWVQIRGERIWLGKWLQRYTGHGTAVMEASELQKGKEIGLYTNYLPVTSEEGVAVANLVVTDPPTPAPSKGLMPIARQQRRQTATGIILFPAIAAAIGLAIGAAEGIVCRTYRRAFTSGMVGMLVGLVGAFFADQIANIAYLGTQTLVARLKNGGQLSALAMLAQMTGRGLTWALIGVAMGLGQGVALRSKRLLFYGVFGGVIGGLIGGLLFDPIDLLLLGDRFVDATYSRMVGFTVIGISVGAMIGVVQLLARDCWLRMTKGPLAGKEFLFYRDVMNVGSSPKCEIYLFNDPQVASRHATLRTVGDDCEIEALDRNRPVIINDRTLTRAKLRHGDRITIGRTSFVFQVRQA